MRHHERTDEEWVIIAPLLPNKVRGVAREDDRRVINGILWRFRTGAPWPTHNPLQPRRALAGAGVWDRLLEAVSAAYDGDIVMIDSSCVRVHQHGAAVKKGRRRSSHGMLPGRPDHQDPCSGRC